MPDPDPTNHTPIVVVLPRRREPLDPDDPAPDHVFEDLSGWDAVRLEALFETLWRTDLDCAWDLTNDRLVFHAGDRHAVTEVLDWFRDAPLHEIDEVLDHYWDEDNNDAEEEEEEEEEGF